MLCAGSTQFCPGDITWLKITWTLATGETVTDESVAASIPADLADSPAPATVGNVTTFWKQNGTAGTATDFEVTIETSGARILHDKLTVTNDWLRPLVWHLSEDDVTPLEFEWNSRVLTASETVSTTTVTAVSNGVVKASPVPITVNGVTTFWVENGTAGTTGIFTAKITTNLNRTLHQRVHVGYH